MNKQTNSHLRNAEAAAESLRALLLSLGVAVEMANRAGYQCHGLMQASLSTCQLTEQMKIPNARVGLAHQEALSLPHGRHHRHPCPPVLWLHVQQQEASAASS